MNQDIDKITQDFNKRLNNIEKNKLIIYRRLMQYRRALHQAERVGNESIVQEYKTQSYNFWGDNGFAMPEGTKNIDELEQYLEEQIQEVFGLIKEYKEAIKKYYTDNELNLSSVLRSRPNRLIRSQNQINQYETEKGDWVFASSIPKEENAYRVRPAFNGMISIADDEYVFFGTGLHLDSSRLELNQPAYYYTLKSDKFMPVVTIERTKEDSNSFEFCFGDEWTSDYDIESQDIIRVEEYTDITDLLDHIQIFSTTYKNVLSELTRHRWNRDEKQKVAQKAFKDGKLTCWNLVLNRGTKDEYKDTKRTLDTNEVKSINVKDDI